MNKHERMKEQIRRHGENLQRIFNVDEGGGKMKQHKYYSVAIGNSTDMQRRPAPGQTCGHKHKTSEAAEKCQNKLIGLNRKTSTCSAKWYNSYILGMGAETWERIY
jgi:hypothetical protein